MMDRNVWKYSKYARNLRGMCGAHTRSCSNQATGNAFVTTPIFYVNAKPHIGHLYTAVLADAHARWNRLKENNVLFSTGTDEHGLKIQQAAQQHDTDPSLYCDKISQDFKNLFDQSGILYDDFIRTTESRHRQAVQTFWEKLAARGHIFRGSYEGWYSVSDEAFLAQEEVTDVVDPSGNTLKVSVTSGHKVTWMKEDNYMFRLSDFKSQLKTWLDSGAVQPVKFKSNVLEYLDYLPDLSVSRQRDRLSWGIPVPGDETQTIYVWLDALVNYLTVAGYPGNMKRWPPTVQVIGKDILKFHAVYWPAFLFAAGLEPPSRLICHSHWMVDSVKMSKSLGNVVDPYECIRNYSVDGIRYFLLKEGTLHSDGNFTKKKVVECINTGLVNTLGNLLSRSTSQAINSKQEFPPLDQQCFESRFSSEDRQNYERLKHLPEIVDDHYNNMTVYKALDHIVSTLHWANGVMQHHKPWELAKQPDQLRYLNTVLHVALETLRTCGIVLQPAVPNICDRLLTKLGQNKRGVRDVNFVADEPLKLGQSEGILLKRLKDNT